MLKHEEMSTVHQQMNVWMNLFNSCTIIYVFIVVIIVLYLLFCD